MLPVLVFFLATFRDSFRTRAGLQAEVLALRHQLVVLQRRNQKHRLRLSVADRLFWVWLSHVWADWRSALRIVKPETVIAWHRKGFRLYWSWKSRPHYGRPAVSMDVRELIRGMSAANPRWGAPRIHGELGKLGIKISETTVANPALLRCGDGSPHEQALKLAAWASDGPDRYSIVCKGLGIAPPASLGPVDVYQANRKAGFSTDSCREQDQHDDARHKQA